MAVSLLTNTFCIPLLDDLSIPYLWVHFDDLVADDAEYDSNVSLLATILSRRLKAPVAPVRRNGEHVLAVALTGNPLPEKVNLLGAVTKLRPGAEKQALRFIGADPIEQEIAKRFLRWELRNSFYRDKGFWEHYGRQAERSPLTLDGYDGPVALHRTYGYGFVPSDDGRIELSVEVGLCYLARLPLQEAAAKNDLNEFKFKRCLYKFGFDWYLVDVSGPTKALGDIEFPDQNGGPFTRLRPYIQDHCGKHAIPEVDALSDSDLALHYRTGQGLTRWAPAPLLYRVYSTETREGAEVHRRAITAPHIRRKNIERAVERVFAGRKIFGKALRLESTMRRLPERRAKFPRLVFGNNTEVSLTFENVRDIKWDSLRAPGVGPAVQTPFDAQYALIPAGLPAPIAGDLLKRLDSEIRRIYATPYNPITLVYDDRSHRLSDQLRSIETALKDRAGYALVVLPTRPHINLYTLLKRRLPNLKIQSQCAQPASILPFYRKDGHMTWTLKTSANGRYASYIRYLALGILAVNRKWLWHLAEGTLSQSAYIGIDVLKGTAVFTFLYLDGSEIYFWIAKSGREERLPRDMVRDLLLDRLPKDFERLGLPPTSCIVIHRDGRLCTSERLALDDVTKQLIRRGLVNQNFAFKVIEVHKNSAYHPRLFVDRDGRTYNPPMGAYRMIGDREAILSTTGEPLLTQGTADPVHLVGAVSSLTPGDVEDFNALSHLGFTSPNACHRLALTLSLADNILRERRPERPEEQAWDDNVAPEDNAYDQPGQ